MELKVNIVTITKCTPKGKEPYTRIDYIATEKPCKSDKVKGFIVSFAFLPADAFEKLDKDLINGGKAYCKQTNEILSYLDVLVDGEFILEQKDITLKWKGSRNQRVIDVPFYLKTSEIKTID